MFGWTAREAALITAADWRGAPVGLQVSRWASGELDWNEAQWQRAREQLEAALRLTPDSPVLLEHLAQLYTVRGRALWGQGEEDSPGVAAFRRAREIQQRVVTLRPLYANPWANLALMHYAANSTVEDTFDAWREALRLGPHEPEVKATLAHVAELTWTVAPPEVLSWLERERPGALKRLEREEAAAVAAAQASSAGASAALPAR